MPYKRHFCETHCITDIITAVTAVVCTLSCIISQLINKSGHLLCHTHTALSEYIRIQKGQKTMKVLWILDVKDPVKRKASSYSCNNIGAAGHIGVVCHQVENHDGTKHIIIPNKTNMRIASLATSETNALSRKQ